MNKTLIVSFLSIVFLFCLTAYANSADLTPCGTGMLPVGDKFCIDEYEYPNIKGEQPLTGVSWYDADKLCREQGERLCTRDEWAGACESRSGIKHSYQKSSCNDGYSVKSGASVVSGAFPDCLSEYGVHDMTGSVWEWVALSPMDASNRSVMGGSFNSRNSYELSCSFPFATIPDKPADDIGFRCCVDMAPSLSGSKAGKEDTGKTNPPPTKISESVIENTSPTVPTVSTRSGDEESPISPEPLPPPDEIKANLRNITDGISRRLATSDSQGAFIAFNAFNIGRIVYFERSGFKYSASVSGISLTAGYKFKSFSVSYSDVENSLESEAEGKIENERVSSGIYSAFARNPCGILGKGTCGIMGENALLGIRLFRNSIGSMDELYLGRHLTYSDKISLNPGIAILKMSGGGSVTDISVDADYSLTNTLSLSLKYDSANFFKIMSNKYLLPKLAVSKYATTGSFSKQSLSAGLSLKSKSSCNYFFSLNDIGDFNYPVGGAFLDF